MAPNLCTERIERVDPCCPMVIQRQQNPYRMMQALRIQHQQGAAWQADTHQPVLRPHDGQILGIDAQRLNIASGNRHDIPNRRWSNRGGPEHGGIRGFDLRINREIATPMLLAISIHPASAGSLRDNRNCGASIPRPDPTDQGF